MNLDELSEIQNGQAGRQRRSGLTDKQVLESRYKHGSNILTPKNRKSPVWRFFCKFGDPLIVILLVAGILSFSISFYEYYAIGGNGYVFLEPVGIFVAVLLSVGLAFGFELKADKEFSLLNQMEDDGLVKVVRNAGVHEISRKDVVVGDVVILSAGDEVPADGTLLECVSLGVDESALTGETICHKTVDSRMFDADATYPSNRLLRGTHIVEGHAVMEVDVVGDGTEHGKVFKEASVDNSVKTPLNEQLERLARFIVRISYVLAALVVVGKLVVYFMSGPVSVESMWTEDGMLHFLTYFLNTLMIAVTLIVVAVPEGLPMAVTLSLAYSMRRMMYANNLVRRMHACETMGAATVICTDKTGTLTQNRMKVVETCFPQEKTLRNFVLEGMAVNSTASLDEGKVIGNPTEGALLLWLNGEGEDYCVWRKKAEVISEIPFTAEQKYMATEVCSENGHVFLVFWIGDLLRLKRQKPLR
ncbi:MAG: HAD-IC family P-type ATPase [Bacteroides sp.]|nr:HAD-IC family P-type ATPase [Roseburia sp.]MCM1347427.1 HAD-IC family P-type ATPase [Bacteroides sp.]MCM1421896.1 HAD-IC family P-type ATPase [Bacteroides sp.]